MTGTKTSLPAYHLTRHLKSRRLSLRLNTEGDVLVTAPRHAGKTDIEAFIIKSRPWIDRERQRLKMRQQVYPVLDWQNNLVRLKGRLYSFELNLIQKEKILINGEKITIKPLTLNPGHLKPTLINYLKTEAATEIINRCLHYSGLMGLTYKKITFRQQKSRWGSCSRQGNLSFNWRLIHYSQDVIDYVVIHELSHLKHLNHSSAFWHLVAKYQPAYKTHRRFLKNQILNLV